MAHQLAATIEELYLSWNKAITQGQIVENVGWQDEAYFRYFDYPDFVNKDRGLLQIRKYAEKNDDADLTVKLSGIADLTKQVREALSQMQRSILNILTDLILSEIHHSPL